MNGTTESYIEIINLSKSFGSHKVLDNINLTVNRGEVVAIIGPSGSGKSTLLRCLNFLARSESGEIKFQNRSWSLNSEGKRYKGKKYEKTLSELRSDVGMVFQNFNVFPHKTAVQNVELGLIKVRKMTKNSAREIAIKKLEQVGLGDKINQYPDKLSGGQKQRIAIARALALEPKVMLFDEATSSLDPELVGGILEEIKRLANTGITMLVVTHEMGFAFQVAHRIVFMDSGKIVEVGTPDEIRNSQESRTRAFLSAIL
ncbi:polar amino acid ABC transporter ATP-binding protein [Actinomycetes bacterium]|nr:polar amino acid ABC transporter ATP-binding protein [Actinomycetes bacterium]